MVLNLKKYFYNLYVVWVFIGSPNEKIQKRAISRWRAMQKHHKYAIRSRPSKVRFRRNLDTIYRCTDPWNMWRNEAREWSYSTQLGSAWRTGLMLLFLTGPHLIWPFSTFKPRAKLFLFLEWSRKHWTSPSQHPRWRTGQEPLSTTSPQEDSPRFIFISSKALNDRLCEDLALYIFLF